MPSSEKPFSFDPLEKLRNDLGDRPVRESLEPVKKRSEAILSENQPGSIVQVVGSNGKGSVVHYLENLLDRSDISTVSYVSPHLSEVRERIHLGAKPISQQGLRNQLKDLPRKLHEDFTPFERLFLASLQLAVDRSVDVLILEAGMGGRWDATSAIPADWTILTSVDREHTRFLGTRRTDILQEQLAQIDPKSRLLSSILSTNELSNALEKIIKKQSLTAVQLNQPDDPDTLNRNLSLSLARFLSDQPAKWLMNQLQPIERPPGRKEIRKQGDRQILLDVAHSPAALREWIRFSREQEEQEKSVLYVYGCLEGKELAENVNVLHENIQPENLWLTRPPSPRALDPKHLLDAWPSSSELKPKVINEPDQALSQLRDDSASTISIAGSFTLIKYFRNKMI